VADGAVSLVFAVCQMFMQMRAYEIAFNATNTLGKRYEAFSGAVWR